MKNVIGIIAKFMDVHAKCKHGICAIILLSAQVLLPLPLLPVLETQSHSAKSRLWAAGAEESLSVTAHSLVLCSFVHLQRNTHQTLCLVKLRGAAFGDWPASGYQEARSPWSVKRGVEEPACSQARGSSQRRQHLPRRYLGLAQAHMYHPRGSRRQPRRALLLLRPGRRGVDAKHHILILRRGHLRRPSPL